METVEIRRNRKLLLVFFVLIVVVVAAAACIFFFSAENSPGRPANLLAIVSAVIAILSLQGFARVLFRKNPVMVFSADGLKLPEQKKSFRWSEIRSWRIETSEDGNRLVFEGPMGQETVSLNYLEQAPKQIEAILSTYASAEKSAS